MSRLQGSKRERTLFNCFALLFIALFTVALTYAYLSRENSYYYWDYASYHDMTAWKVVSLRNLSGDPVLSLLYKVLRDIWASTARDYSDLHSLPLVPIFLLLGSSRLVYILSMAFLYLLPFTFIVGAITTKLVPSQPRHIVFWSATFITVLLPATWLPTLRGYPDTLSATLIGLAILIYLQDTHLQRSWQIMSIGLCIALAILIRRHFVYAGLSFFVAISLQTLLLFAGVARKHPRTAWRQLLLSTGRIGLTAVFLLVFLLVLGWPFVERVTQTNFGLLYASYAVPFGKAFQYYQSHYGLLACTLAVVGFIGAMRSPALSSPVARFLLLFCTVSTLQWLLGVRQLGIHYTLHFTWGIIFGLVALVWVICNSFPTGARLLVNGVLIIYFAFNFYAGLSTTGVLRHLNISAPRLEVLQHLFSANYPPLYRSDHQELLRLIDYLREVAGPDDPIYVAASSFVLNDDLLWHGQYILHEHVLSYSVEDFWRTRNLNILRWIPFADSRDAYPLDLLISSEYVVVATPFQHHLAPDEQEVLRIVVDAFRENWEVAQDFSRLPQQFVLSDNVTVTIYRRVRATSLATTLHTLHAMQDYMEERPGGQLDLIKVSGASDSYISEEPDGGYEIVLDAQASQTSFLYIDPVTDRAMTTGRLAYYDTNCTSNVGFRMDLVDKDGQVIGLPQFVQPGADDNSFSLTLQPHRSTYLLFTISADYESGSTGPCWLIIEDLTVTKLPDENASRIIRRLPEVSIPL